MIGRRAFMQLLVGLSGAGMIPKDWLGREAAASFDPQLPSDAIMALTPRGWVAYDRGGGVLAYGRFFVADWKRRG